MSYLALKDLTRPDRWHVLDTATDRLVTKEGGRVRWFKSAEKAAEYADALARGLRRPSGFR